MFRLIEDRRVERGRGEDDDDGSNMNGVEKYDEEGSISVFE